MKNSTYWANRMRIMQESLLDNGYEYVQNLESQYEMAIAEIDKKIAAWYQRFANNNEISLAEAKKLLNSDELEEFKWTVKSYIEHGEANALSGEWLKQLENASSRVHISRLDSLKLQLRQEAEVLHGSQLKATESLLGDVYREGYFHTAFELQKGLGVGWSLHGMSSSAIEKVLSRPWTTDGQTFRDRVWTNKAALVNSVNTNLTQMLMRGEAPDKAIKAIAKQFGVSKSKAGRLVMTESAAFASAAQNDCFTALDVEQYKIIATLDKETCDLCGALDGQVYKMSEYQVGLTAPPFHPWCRCCTAPYFADMEDWETKRAARDPEGKTYEVPSNMNYRTWDSYNKAVSHETRITAALRTTASDLGVELSGLEYRAKTAESYTRKVNTEAREYMQSHAGVTYEEAYAYATSHMYDTVRYTFLSDSGEFTSNFSKAVYKLKKSGYNICRVKNSLPDTSASYRGVNTVFSTSDGFKFEVQFHTPESLAVKNQTYTLYEEYRKATTTQERRIELEKEMRRITSSLKTPKDAETIIPFDDLKGR